MVDFVTYGAAFWMCIGFSFLALIMVARRVERGDATYETAAESLPIHAAPKNNAWSPGVAVLAVIVLFLTLGTSLHTPMIGAYTHDVLRVKMSYMAMLFPVPGALGGIILWRYGHLTDHYGRQVPLVLLTPRMALPPGA